MTRLAALVLAAGKGKRMKSDVPKVLHRLGGRPLVTFPVMLARSLGASPTIIVVGHGRERVEEAVRALPGGDEVAFAVQGEQRGTGHAVECALGALRGHRGQVLVLSGDVPLLDKASVSRLRRAYDKAGGPAALLTFEPASPRGYGRVLRDEDGRVIAVREDRDCTRAERAVREVNAGIYLFDSAFLRRAVRGLRRDNAQGELYLTDLVAAASRRSEVPAVSAPEECVRGVNDREDLASLEEVLDGRTNAAAMRSGVTMRRPGTIHLDLDVEVGRDTEIGPGVQLLGRTRVGKGCSIGTGAVVVDSTLEDGAIVRPYSVMEGAIVGARAEVGPMGRLRPGTVLGEGAKTGNFVEVKNTVIGAGSKANHLAYLGDGVVGEGCNVGAGTIFCNYDGVAKHRTVLEDGVFVGSDSQLVAPVRVGRGSYVASGSTVTRDVPPNSLAISRTRQKNKEGLASALRSSLEAQKRSRESAGSDPADEPGEGGGGRG